MRPNSGFLYQFPQTIGEIAGLAFPNCKLVLPAPEALTGLRTPRCCYLAFISSLVVQPGAVHVPTVYYAFPPRAPRAFLVLRRFFAPRRETQLFAPFLAFELGWGPWGLTLPASACAGAGDFYLPTPLLYGRLAPFLALYARGTSRWHPQFTQRSQKPRLVAIWCREHLSQSRGNGSSLGVWIPSL